MISSIVCAFAAQFALPPFQHSSSATLRQIQKILISKEEDGAPGFKVSGVGFGASGFSSSFFSGRTQQKHGKLESFQLLKCIRFGYGVVTAVLQVRCATCSSSRALAFCFGGI